MITSLSFFSSSEFQKKLKDRKKTGKKTNIKRESLNFLLLNKLTEAIIHKRVKKEKPYTPINCDI